MAAVFFFLLLALTAIPAGATEDKVQTDLSSSASEIIARANANIPKRLMHGDIVPNSNRNADLCTARGCMWPKRRRSVIVPIVISSSFTRAERDRIITSLLTFHHNTCIRFVRRRWWHWNYLHFFPGNGCWSYLGRQSRGQPISLQKNGCLYRSTVQHEVLHALGFHHEHIRSDRDGHVAVLAGNIQPGREGNFVKVQTNNLDTPYDFDSVMHYSNKAFSKNGNPTIVARSNPERSFGYARQMSANDIVRVNRLYRCCEWKYNLI